MREGCQVALIKLYLPLEKPVNIDTALTVGSLAVIPCSYLIDAFRVIKHGWLGNPRAKLMGKTSINQDFHLPSLNTGDNLDFWHGWNISVVEWSSKPHCCQPCSTQGADPKSRDVSQFKAKEMRYIYIYVKRLQSFGIGGAQILRQLHIISIWFTMMKYPLTNCAWGCHCINPALQPKSRFQGSKVAMLSGKVPRLCRVPGFHSCRFPGLQGCRFRELQGSNVQDYRGSGVPSFQGSRFQASGLQTCKGLGLIHQQRSDQRNAKQTQNTIELLQCI